ncbi:MAG: SRPBCC family protein [Mycobacterium sp.]
MGRRNQGSFTLERFYPHPRHRLWEFLISAEFFPSGWEHELLRSAVTTGRSFVIKTDPIPGTRITGLGDCEFLHVAPGRAGRWRYTSIGPKPWTCYGAWTLHCEGLGTRLIWTTSGFNPRKPNELHTRVVFENQQEAMLEALAALLDAATSQTDEPG